MRKCQLNHNPLLQEKINNVIVVCLLVFGNLDDYCHLICIWQTNAVLICAAVIVYL